jgi:hypothetical protein
MERDCNFLWEQRLSEPAENLFMLLFIEGRERSFSFLPPLHICTCPLINEISLDFSFSGKPQSGIQGKILVYFAGEKRQTEAYWSWLLL